MDSPAEVRIERLAVRLRGIPSSLARAAMDGLGRELMEQLAGLPTPPTTDRRLDLPLLDAGTVRVPHLAGTAEVRGAIVQAVVRSIETVQGAERKG